MQSYFANTKFMDCDALGDTQIMQVHYVYLWAARSDQVCLEAAEPAELGVDSGDESMLRARCACAL